MPGTNITVLQTVANGLQELKDEVVFVGGAVAELYASDPAASDIPGFSNRWYHEGIENKIVKTLSNGNPIFLFPPEYYLAAKFDAQLDWGGNDLRQRRDFGEIIFILENCPTILDDFGEANESVKNYLIIRWSNSPMLCIGILGPGFYPGVNTF